MNLNKTLLFQPELQKISKLLMTCLRRKSLYPGTVVEALSILDILVGLILVCTKTILIQNVIPLIDAPEKDEDWQQTAEDVQRSAAMYRDTLNDTLPVVESVKRKAKSAKSHIFRKDRVSAE